MGNQSAKTLIDRADRKSFESKTVIDTSVIHVNEYGLALIIAKAVIREECLNCTVDASIKAIVENNPHMSKEEDLEYLNKKLHNNNSSILMGNFDMYRDFECNCKVLTCSYDGRVFHSKSYGPSYENGKKYYKYGTDYYHISPKSIQVVLLRENANIKRVREKYTGSIKKNSNTYIVMETDKYELLFPRAIVATIVDDPTFVDRIKANRRKTEVGFVAKMFKAKGVILPENITPQDIEVKTYSSVKTSTWSCHKKYVRICEYCPGVDASLVDVLYTYNPDEEGVYLGVIPIVYGGTEETLQYKGIRREWKFEEIPGVGVPFRKKSDEPQFLISNHMRTISKESPGEGSGSNVSPPYPVVDTPPPYHKVKK